MTVVAQDAESLRATHAELRDRLLHAGLLIRTDVDGLYGRSRTFEAVLHAVDAQVRVVGADDDAEFLAFPPVLPRTTFDRIAYMRSFPNLGGAVFSFAGGDREHAALVQQIDAGEPYDHALTRTDVALLPACCYPVYPTATGHLPANGRAFEIVNYCFRNEPSVDPMRMVAFRQLEHVRLGTPAQIQEFRAAWLERVPRFFGELGLTVQTDTASDAFFGRAGRFMASAQLEQELKFEFLVPVHGVDHPTACASLNYHQEHFGELFGIETDEGHAHSSCIGFGLERCAVALFATHGVDPDGWPASVRARLWP